MLDCIIYFLSLFFCKYNLKWILQVESKNGQLDRHFFSFTRETDTDGACGKLKSLRIMLHEERPFIVFNGSGSESNLMITYLPPPPMNLNSRVFSPAL
jgi:hypothetical protein